MKALESLNDKIEGISTGEGATEIAKSEDATPSVNIPSTQDMAKMSWDEVHALADRAFKRGE